MLGLNTHKTQMLITNTIKAISFPRPCGAKIPAHVDIFDWIIMNLTEDRFYSKIQLQLLFELGRTSKYCDEILFYPSSGSDIKDIITIPTLKDNELIYGVPKIFIHNDAIALSEFDLLRQFELYEDSLTILGNSEYTINDGIQINILKFKRKNEELGWLLQISNHRNEDTLKLFLTHKLKVKYLYSVCDGIIHGMGGVINREECLPVIMYTYFAEVLNCRFHFSEFPIDHLLDLDAQWFENVHEFINNLPENLRRVINNHFELGIDSFCDEFSCNVIGDWHKELIYPNYDNLYLIFKR